MKCFAFHLFDMFLFLSLGPSWRGSKAIMHLFCMASIVRLLSSRYWRLWTIKATGFRLSDHQSQWQSKLCRIINVSSTAGAPIEIMVKSLLKHHASILDPSLMMIIPQLLSNHKKINRFKITDHDGSETTVRSSVQPAISNSHIVFPVISC